jgi:hypothetical protein
MGSSVYVASVEGYTGKSTVALGVLQQLSRRVERNTGNNTKAVQPSVNAERSGR